MNIYKISKHALSFGILTFVILNNTKFCKNVRTSKIGGQAEIEI